MTVAFLFPGQGAQSEGLLHRLPQHAEVTRTIADASALLGLDLGALDTAQALHSTAAVQLGLLVAPNWAISNVRRRQAKVKLGSTGSYCSAAANVALAPCW